MFDIACSATGDLVPNGVGGLSTVTGTACDYQDVNWRCLTNNPEQLLWSIGANLEDCIGLPNSAATGTQGCNSIVAALTIDGRFAPFDVSATATPISTNQIEFTVGITDPSVMTSPVFYTTVVQLESD